ncbi:MAG: GCN5-related N-acetyltransferase [Candidatus Eremiobacteraeota bacterium]|nr:GCN5-related N-acetyltransferase [Candidatus Eremiobacteraeota bacterium]
MTAVALRRATVEDAQLLAEHRAAIWVEVGDWSAEAMAAQTPVWTDFTRRTVADGTYVAWIAEERGEPIASGAILVQLAIPRPGSDSERAGRVQSVYVVPPARRRGVARAVMDALLADARDLGLIWLSLHPSDEARGLYASMGFTAGDEMLLRLSGA